MKKSGQWRRMEGAKPSIVLTLTDEAESFALTLELLKLFQRAISNH
jgi:hypothetical protein